MNGAPSQVDTFDPKPALAKYDGTPYSGPLKVGSNGRPVGYLMRSPFEFRRHGQSGLPISSLFPHTAQHADDLCVLRAMYTDTAAHASGCLQMNTGSVLIGKPSLGAWLSYGLGAINENLPNFVVMTDPRGGPIGSASNWSSGFMPASYQGTLFRSGGSPLLDLATPPGISDRSQRESIDLINRAQSAAPVRAPRRIGAGGPHSVVRAGLSHADVGGRSGRFRPRIARRPAQRYGLDDKRTARFRPQVPDRPPADRARRAVRAALFRRRAHRRHLGRPHRLHHEPQAARRRDRPADRRA